MSIRIIVNGAQGKMGQLTVKTLATDPDFTLVSCTHKEHNLALEIKHHQADVVIDFTNAHCIHDNLSAIINAGAHPVIGTSGLAEDDIRVFQKQCKERRLGGIIAPNFSISAILMMKYAQEIARYFPNIEIIEMHHAGKLDSPSGTAMRTAELLAKARMSIPDATQNTRETVAGARGAQYQNIPIHAIRLPGILASQQIIFGGMGETLTIRDDVISRDCYMPGIILACKKVMDLHELVYGLEHLL